MISRLLARFTRSHPVGTQAALRTLCCVGVALMSAACSAADDEEPLAVSPTSVFEDRVEERHAMVATQIQARGVLDAKVIAAMRRVPRHALVPKSERASAYADYPLPIGHEQTISQPYIVAAMTEALGLVGGERVLEIGTGSGYQAAVLAEIAAEVYTIEIVAPLGERAKRDLVQLGYDNIHFLVGDGYLGWPDAAPFQGIMVTAAPPEVPQPLIDQLAPGGRMVIPVGVGDQELLLIEKSPTGESTRRLMPVRFVPMTGKAQEGAPD